MPAEPAPYEHMPVFGLPKSLLQLEGRATAVIALMQRQAGLNRERRRELHDKYKLQEVPSDLALHKLSKADRSALPIFLDPDHRFGSFMAVAAKLANQKSPTGTLAYAVAIDVQLLRAYESNWFDQPLHEEVLIAACPEWIRIKEQLEKSWFRSDKSIPLGVFMLWPRLRSDLARWNELDANFKLTVGHAVFALSSIGRTFWFIDEALKQCPALAGDLGDLKPKAQGRIADTNLHDKENETESGGPAGAESVYGSKQIAADIMTNWSELGGHLTDLQAAWGTSPSRALASQLITLGNEASDLLASMPADTVPPIKLFEQGIEKLCTSLREARSNGDLAWISDDDLDGIKARWWLEVADAGNDTVVIDLSQDAALALDRVATAVRKIQLAKQSLEDARLVVSKLEAQLGGLTTAAGRIELSKLRQEAKQKELAEEREHTDIMLLVLASASPWGKAFNTKVNYSDELSTRNESVDIEQEDLVDDELPTSSTKNEAEAAPAELAPPPTYMVAIGEKAFPTSNTLAEFVSSEGIGIATSETPISMEPSSRVVELATNSPAPALDATSAPTLPVQEVIVSNFTDEAGDECRPIWSLLRHGRPALAYLYAQEVHRVSHELHVPPLALLRAVALAPGLTSSDGPLSMSIAECFANIEPVWFSSGDAPSSWHTAVNLLLIAATLRPMILAPGTGAAAIARYRHLDGRHEALLQLVRKVGDLSEPMIGLSIGPSILRSAANEAGQRNQLKSLSNTADEWLNIRAPLKKIRYAPASKVWLHWLKSGEKIHKLISPVARGAIEEQGTVRTAIAELSNYELFLEHLQETDRRQLGRRGPDIVAGALEHLWVATGEAVAIARSWLATADMQSDSRSRLRALVGQLQSAFQAHAGEALEELNAPLEDNWGLIKAASCVLEAEIRAISGMFLQSDAVPVAEAMASELLARDLLWVPGTSIGPGWVIETGGADLLPALKAWAAAPLDITSAFDHRVKVGDLSGAENLLSHPAITGDKRVHELAIERARDLWAKDLQQLVQKARRATEVGLAYGYLSDAERSAFESEFSALEVGQRETTRFDYAARKISSLMDRIENQKSMRVASAQRDFDREKSSLSNVVAQQVEAPLARSDIHTFNELLQRVRQGLDPWPERDLRRDAFGDFYPKVATDLQAQLLKLPPEAIDKAIRNGEAIGQLSFDLDGDEQARSDAEQVYNVWATAASKKTLSREALRKILVALGVPIRGIEQDRTGRDSWLLETNPIDDRDVCPVPHFGSRAMGRYRVVVLKERPEDLLQSIGDNTQHTATIVVSLANVRATFLAELARMSKERQRSFLLLDQVMLLFILAQPAARLATWFGIALPFTYSEPYDASAGFVPGEMFYGRASELESVMAQGGCYFIYGGRQLGKTALLRRAERTFHEPSSDRYALWLDTLAQGIGERRPAVDIWLAVSEKLRELKITGLDLPAVNPAKSTSIDSFLAAIKSFLTAKPSRRMLLLLDEADHFFEHDARQGSPYSETRRFKQLMDETERRFKVVFAGLHNVLRTASTSNQPLGHLNEAVRIGPLMDEREIRAAEELITRPIEAAGFEFEDRSLVMRVLAQTNYYPSLIQLYCTQVLRHLRENKLRRQGNAGPRFRIDESDIETVFSGRPLRDAIRSKFRLTLQLDDRYEVIANALGLEALAPGFDHTKGIEWRTIWEDCKTTWWPEGFDRTTEREFLALLEEMVQLGVLSQAKTPDRFTLRNPNVLLLLGSKQEIEDTLQAEREPRIEFESTIFRPALGGRVDDPARNPLTYRQLDEVMQMRSSVSLIAASEAAGASNLAAGLRDQPGMSESRVFVALDRSSDKKSFSQELDREVKNRIAEGITLMLVPSSVPWDVEWVALARAKLNALTSRTKFVSVVFAADPKRLWELVLAAPIGVSWPEPWLSILPWDRGFVRKWLEELQFPPDAVDRLYPLTGYWGGLLATAARVKGGALDFAANLDRVAKLVNETEWRRETLHLLTGGIEQVECVLATMNSLGDGVTESDLAEVGELPQQLVERTMRWAEPLGIAIRINGAGWTLDPFVKRMLEGLGK